MEIKYSPQFIKKILLLDRKAPEARFKSGAAMMAYLNKPRKVKKKARR